MQKITLDENVAVLTSTGYVLAKDLQPFDTLVCVDGTSRKPQVLRTRKSDMQKLTLKSRPSIPFVVEPHVCLYTKRQPFHFSSEYRALDAIKNGQYLESAVDDGNHVALAASAKSEAYWEMVGMLAMRGYVHPTFIEDEMSISLKLLDRHIEDTELMGAFERAGFGRWLSKTTCTNTKQVNELMAMMELPEAVFALSFDKRKALLKGLCGYVMPRVTNHGRSITHLISSSNWALLTAIARLTASLTGDLPKISTKDYQTQIGYSINVTFDNPDFELETDTVSPRPEPIDDDELFDELEASPVGILDEVIGVENIKDCKVITFILNTDRPIVVDNFSLCTKPLSSIAQGMEMS